MTNHPQPLLFDDAECFPLFSGVAQHYQAQTFAPPEAWRQLPISVEREHAEYIVGNDGEYEYHSTATLIALLRMQGHPQPAAFVANIYADPGRYYPGFAWHVTSPHRPTDS